MKKRKSRSTIKNCEQRLSKEHIVEQLRLPRDLMLGDSILTLTGKHTLCIENYKGIIEYTSTIIVIQGKNGQIHVEGKNLLIEYYTNEDMKIVGLICKIQYL
ncbi:MAG: YabP/YqfC family sporulation protein [Lachnospiraceae bacterium]|nr:YabP/YqfC family sporulation protein [Lachnospiraceae bacterium]